MEKTKIISFRNRKFNELSGGEKQRVVIAQAIVQNTPIVLLDEPTAHLDINFQIELMDLFIKLNIEDNKTIIGVFHDINLAIQYSSKIMFLKEGEIYGYGDIKDIVNKENIKNVFKSDVYIGKNPYSGKLYISPSFGADYKKDISKKDVKIHVIGGGGAASPVLNLLYDKGYILSCGVVNSLDTDIDTAEILNIPYISEAPFSPISIESQNKNLKLIRESDIVVLPEIEYGHGNYSNLVSVREAMEMGKKVIIISKKSIKKRDHTDGKAIELYEKIIDGNAVVIKSLNSIIKVI